MESFDFRSPYLLLTFLVLSLTLLYFSPLSQIHFPIKLYSSTTPASSSPHRTYSTNIQVSPSPSPAPTQPHRHVDTPTIRPNQSVPDHVKVSNNYITIIWDFERVKMCTCVCLLFVYEQKKKKSSIGRIEGDLSKAREAIRKAITTKNYTSDAHQIYVPTGSIYRNPYAFHQLSVFFFFFFGFFHPY